MTILDLLDRDHDEMRAALRRLSTVPAELLHNPWAAAQHTMLADMVRRRASSDHAVFYKALGDQAAQRRWTDAWRRDERLLRSLEEAIQAHRARSQPASWKCALATLRLELAQHAERERREVFARALRLLDDQQLQALFYKAQRRKRRRFPKTA